ncbi:IS4 family transposase [Sorangium sp. So ce854]|uniref:IS4 family transposase n=1 Tax=Sorangium sp. So ce854 TaxID=3133322 RepID=UPI003F637FB9
MAKPSDKPTSAPPAVPVPFLAKYHELFDADELWAAARQMGAVTRDRKVDVSALVEASVLAMSGLPGTQTTIFANYIQLTGQDLAPSAFYDRFTVPFANLMADVTRRAMAAVRAVDPSLRDVAEMERLLEHFSDVQVADSSCRVLRKLAACWSPSTSPERPASFKIHAVISLKDNLPIEHHISPQREHDNPHLDESVLTPGALLLADLGYVDHERLLRLKARCVHILMRLKASQNPRIARVRVGRGDKRLCRGMKLDEALATGALYFEKGRLDVDVVLAARVDGRRVEGTFRVVGSAPADGGEDRYYLTSVPPDVLTPDDVALTYTLRWDIELLWKHLKTGTGLTAIRAWRPAAVFALVDAR